MNAFWIAIIVIGIFTYVSRVLPFFTPRRRSGRPPAWLDALGPALLAAMAVTIFAPQAGAALAHGTLAVYLVGLATAALVMMFSKDPGFATLGGVLGWWLASLALS